MSLAPTLEKQRSSRRSHAARAGRAAALLAALVFASPPAAAAEPDLNDLALAWARGQFGAPLLCELDGVPRRVARRVLIAPGPRDGRGRVDRIRIYPLEAPPATRCFDTFGRAEPDAEGTLEVWLPGPSRPDMAQREFGHALRREQGFDFEVRSGKLRLGSAGTPRSEWKDVDFAGGRARLHRIAPGSDLARLLAEHESPHKLALELEAPDGTRVGLALVQVGAR